MPITAAQRRTLQHTLRNVFSMDRLRDGQQAVIERVLEGRPTIAVMPTGAGKSLCYQLPAFLLPGQVIVVSPLIALMKDQCDGLREHGVEAIALHSLLSADAQRDAESAIRDGRARVVFTTPEQLTDPDFIALLSQRPTSLLAVDEAHCISQWGHDFRPAFLEIGHAARALGRPTLLALTATATPDVLTDIATQLHMGRHELVNTGVFRDNLHYEVVPVTDEAAKRDALRAAVQRLDGHGIVYCATVAAVESVYALLSDAGESVTRYHGKMPGGARSVNQDAFMDGRARIMVATNAFGLGIDKADIRFVLHYQLTASLDAYYQEAGRGGRDGAPCTCVLLYQEKDRSIQRFFMGGRYPGKDDVLALYEALNPDRQPRLTALDEVVAHTGRARAKLQVALSLLRSHHILSVTHAGAIRLKKTTLDRSTLATLVAEYDERRASDRRNLDDMVAYARSGACRWGFLLKHFGGDTAIERCGTCDSCRRIEEVSAQTQGAPTDEIPGTDPAHTAGQARAAGARKIEEAGAFARQAAATSLSNVPELPDVPNLSALPKRSNMSDLPNRSNMSNPSNLWEPPEPPELSERSAAAGLPVQTVQDGALPVAGHLMENDVANGNTSVTPKLM